MSEDIDVNINVDDAVVPAVNVSDSIVPAIKAPEMINYVPCSISVGTTTTLAEGSSATVTNSGDQYNAVLDFGIPKGDTGKSAYQAAQEGGYTGSESDFNAALASDIATVASNISDVNAVGQSISDVNSVADSLTDIATVATNVSDVNTVAGISSDVTSVVSISSAVSTVASHDTEVLLVSDNMASVMTTASNIGDVSTVAGISSGVSTVAGISSDIEAVADNATDISSVAANNTNITAVANNETNINAVNANKTNIDAVAGNSSNITAVAGNATNINAVNANKTNIDAVAGNATNINAVASDLTNIDTAVTNMSAIIAAPTEATNAATSATNAQKWAEGTDSQVTPLGGEHSAKGWANVAKQYAESIGAALKYKGSVSTYSALPATGQEVGDTWNVLDTGDNYAWTGTEWDKLSGTVDLSAYRTAADQDVIDSGKQATITGAATSITSSNLTASKALVSDANGKVAASSVTSTELGYVSGVTSAIQTQISNKQDTISDLETIRSGASAGATAVQPGDLATVATSGSYTDLLNKPTIPTVNNATLTIQKNGTDVATFTANSSSNATANITVPTQASDIGAQETLVSGTNIKTINSNSILGSGNISIDSLPSQTGQSGKYLTTDGTDASWANISGEFLPITGGTMHPATGQTDVRIEAVDDNENSLGELNFLQGNLELICKGDINVRADDDGQINIDASDGTGGIAIKTDTADIAFETNSGDVTINGDKVLTEVDITGLPDQTGQSGKYLTTDGTDASWANVDALPSQTGQSGKFLTTNGTSASWATVSIPTVNNATLTITQGGSTKGTFTANASSDVTIDIDAGGSVDIDSKSITTNSSDEIQTVGVIDQNDTTKAIKTWTGTKAQYDAIVSKDSDTFYNITDDEVTADFANTSLSNLTNAGKIVGSGLGMPSGIHISVPVGASGSSYTAPANGYFYVGYTATSFGGWALLYNANCGLDSTVIRSAGHGAGWWYRGKVACKKGDIVYLSWDAVNLDFLQFHYAEGSKSEA